MRCGLLWKLGLGGLFLFSTLSVARAQENAVTTADEASSSPTAFLQAHDARAQDILAQAPGDSLSAKLRQQFKDHINAAFDFKKLSRLSLGSHWKERSADERTEFTRVFSGIIAVKNFDAFLSYYRKGDIAYQEETLQGSQATVKALVPTEKGEKVEVVYYLHLVEDRWRVYDLAIDGASTADGNKRQYARYIKKRSYEELIQRLHQQLDRLTSKNN